MSMDTFPMSEFEQSLKELLDGGPLHRAPRRRRGRPAAGPGLSYAKRDVIYCKFYKLRKKHTRTFLETNSNQLFNCGRRKLKEVLVYHDEEMRDAIADSAYEEMRL
jgi:hypothetical protein